MEEFVNDQDRRSDQGGFDGRFLREPCATLRALAKVSVRGVDPSPFLYFQ
jgi:hypothetical protein